MRPLSALELLGVWERGRRQSPVRQALLLLEAACPDETPEALAALPVGRRDARLLKLRALMLGSHLESVVACPACGEQLEFSLEAETLLVTVEEDLPETFTIQSDGYEVSFRLPNSLDLADVAAREDAGAAREDAGAALLLERCLVYARQENQDVTVAQLPEEVAAAIVDGMLHADPQAEVHLALSCPACAHQWQSLFDIVSFFWGELEAWARRLLYDVHTLASAYGWREADILAMSAWRREQYLNMANR